MLKRYVAWGWRLGFKIMLFHITIFPIILAPIIYFSDPNGSEINMNFGRYSQAWAALFSLAVGITFTSLTVIYLKYLKPIFDSYKERDGNYKDWLD